MSRPVAVVRAETTVRAARALAHHAGVEALPVVDAEGDLIGVVGYSDQLDSPRGELSTVAEVMTNPLISVGPGATGGELAQVMLAHQLRVPPIIARGTLVRCDRPK
ncbi:MAG TPA: CBS domain-containing protein [Pseudonocardiaceae bacterium]|nr:CBS domain-containing protein [Pseudonocardiaceae bacterium]